MKFGMCADPRLCADVAAAGFGYLEAALTAVAAMSEEVFEQAAGALAQSGLQAEALNVMLPGTFRLTGPDADLSPIRNYLELGLARAEKLGAKVQVFGSGAARRNPEGWPKEKAMDQLVEYLALAAPIAARHGIALAIEPLNPGECNLINTVSDGLALAKRVSLPNVGVLADWFHMAIQDEGVGGILAAGPMLLHCHIANPEGRRFPLPDDGADFTGFFDALRKIDYTGRVSVEGGGSPEEYASALARLEECL